MHANLHNRALSGRTCLQGLLLAVTLLFASPHTGHSQSASRWRVYKTADGLDDSLCTTVTLTRQTNVWISHFQNGFVSGYDGYTMKKVPAPGVGPFRVYETDEGQLWAVSGEGLQQFRDDRWLQHPLPEIRALGPANSLAQIRQVSLFPYKQGHLLLCLPQMLEDFSNEASPRTTVLKASSDTRLQRFADMSPARDGGVWITGAKGLARIRGPIKSPSTNLVFEEFIPPPGLNIENLQRPFEDESGGVTLVAESTLDQKRAIVYFDGHEWTVQPMRQRVRLAWRDSERTLWAMTSNSLLRREHGSIEFTEEQEVSVSQFFDAAVDPSGAVWIATSDGLFCRVRLPWQTPAAIKQINGRVHSFAEDAEGHLWMASNVGLHCYNKQKLESFDYPETLERFFQPADSLYFLPQNKLVMNSDGRILQFDLRTHAFSFLAHPSGAHMKIVGWLKSGVLCVQVQKEGAPGTQLQGFDGQKFSPFIDLPAKWNAATEITGFLATQNNICWAGTSTGVAVYENDSWKMFSPSEGVAPDSAYTFVETIDGRIWCGGNERIWEFDGKGWIGVRGGFDHVNRLVKTKSGTCWAASNNGILALNKGDWLLNSIQEGLANSAVITVFEDHKRNIWAGTAHGVSLYHAAVDVDPPQASVEQISPEKSNFPADTVTIAFKAHDRWRTTPSDRLLYSYRLDEQNWTPWSSSDSVAFSELASGKHVFQMRTIDRSWNITKDPAVLNFAITLPWYQETRLVLIALTGCGVALFFAVLAYNRHRKLVHSYAEIEKIVALRTQQLEKANKELLHSQKMMALGTLSAGIAHDFNNILSIIKGSAQIIETNLEDREKIHTRLNRIKTVVEQGSGIVKAMLGFSRRSEKKLSLCDINLLVEETIKLLGDRFLREVDIKFERTGAFPQVPASREFIQQILLNFIFNAADALNGPGRILLRTGQTTQLTDYIALYPATAPEYLFIAVEDFGCGIDPETMPRIFEPFFTTKAFSARRGTGLGLSMVYELAKEIGCGLAVQSTVGKGSVFMLLLPLVPPNDGLNSMQ